MYCDNKFIMGKKSKKEIEEILDLLDKLYPDAECELKHTNAFELLIATMLSAQTTDIKVNEVTEELFKIANTPQDFINMSQEELENHIRVIGLYKNKAKNIKKMCETLIQDYNGEVPREKEELVKLAGVGVKTANVVVSNAFGVPAIAVDTHVFRVSNRIGLAEAKDVTKTEEQLQNNIPKEMWTKAHHMIIFHGRRQCKARKPECESCLIAPLCDFYNGKL